MKQFLTIVCFLILPSAWAETYYVKSAGGSGSGVDDANAWNLTKLNSASLVYGDTVLFKRGDTFYGTITAGHSGITFDAYGTGANPVISGFAQLSSWTLSSGHIYYASLNVPTLNMVTLDGVVQRMGRYPNSGYLAYTSHSGNSSIAGTTVGAIPFDPAGGEVVIRKARWILDRHPITSRSSNTLNYTAVTAYGHNDLYSPVDGNGYFIQGNLGALDQEGEWYYDTTANRLYMHFGTGTPSGRIVRAATTDQNIYINYWNNLSFNNIDFEGANIYGAYVIGTDHIRFTGCNFRDQGGDGVWMSFTNRVSIDNCTITNALNNGIMAEQDADSTTIDNVATYNCGMIAGAGRSGDAVNQAMYVAGDTNLIQNCRVVNSGYIGIGVYGNVLLVQHNLVDSLGTVKDDGAGIYTYSGTGVTNVNRVIKKNIVLHAIGAFAGAEANYWEDYGKEAGIYIDGDANHTTVDSNVVAYGDWGGIFLNGNANNTVTHNLAYDCRYQLLLSTGTGFLLRNVTVTNNQFIARTADQECLNIGLFINEAPSLVGTLDNNVYARPIDDDSVIIIDRRYSGGNGENHTTLATWKGSYSQDAGSVGSAVQISDAARLRFDYSTAGTTIPLSGYFKSADGALKANSYDLAPYTGNVLISVSLKAMKANGKVLRLNGKTIIQIN